MPVCRNILLEFTDKLLAIADILLLLDDLYKTMLFFLTFRIPLLRLGLFETPISCENARTPLYSPLAVWILRDAAMFCEAI